MSATSAPTPSAAGPKVRKFPCPACGADVVWNPGVSALKCPYCGAEKAIPTTAKEIKEHPIEEALSAPRDTGWGAERKAVKCTRCGSLTTFGPDVKAGRCAFCGTPAVVEAPPSVSMVRPEGLLPFKVDRGTATSKFRSWVSGLWFRPNDLPSRSSLSEIAGVYLPFWTFDAATQSAWSADAGFNETYAVEVVENGQRVTRTETRTRWEPASGFLEKFFDDVPVEASRGLERSLAESIEPFPTSDLVPYDPSYLSGFLAEEYALEAQDALTVARSRMESEIRAACVAEIPGDTYRNLVVDTAYSGVAYKNALLPIWIAAYLYAGKSYRFLVNGVTGKVAGKAPFSVVKIALAVIAAILAIIVLANLKR